MSQRCRLISLTLAGWLLVSGNLSAEALPAPQSTASTQPAGNIDLLIKQLGSDRDHDRDSAQKQLTDLGEPVLPALKNAADNDEDPEIRSRSAAVITAINDRDENQPSLITCHLKEATPDQAFEIIGGQAHATLEGVGLGVQVSGKHNRTVTLDAENKPFWELMADVCAQLHVTPALDTTARGYMRLSPGADNWFAPQWHEIAGPVWVSVVLLNHSRTVDLTSKQTNRDQFSVHMIVYPEPKLVVTHISDFVVKEATDDAGNKLMPIPPPFGEPAAYLRSADQLKHQIDVGLSYPAEKPGSKISMLRGEFTVVVADGFQRYQVDDLFGTPRARGPLDRAGVQVQVVPQGTEYQVTIQCKRGDIGEKQWAAMVEYMDVSLLDAKGNPLYAVVPAGIRLRNLTAGMEMFKATATFSKESRHGSGRAVPLNVEDPVSLRWNFPTSLKSIECQASFRNLPMP